jgi:polysaccharide pyruvyl transferase WcaK-like protein
LRVYRSLDFLLATRMHSAVLAACAETPFSVFGYVGGKARGLIDDLGLPDWVTTSEPSSLPETALECYRHRSHLRVQIRAGVSAARKRIRSLDLKECWETA